MRFLYREPHFIQHLDPDKTIGEAFLLENDYLNLKSRVEARMALVDVTATTADNLLAQTVQEELISRNHQLKRLTHIEHSLG